MSRRQSVLIVDVVIDSWKQALANHEEVELPIGTLHISKRKTRRVFETETNLKNVKRHLYDTNKQQFGVQLVKKRLGELNPWSQEPADSIILAAPPNDRNECSQMTQEDHALSPEKLAQLNRYAHLTRYL
jgi:nucleoid DNA-binding protein